MLVESSETVVCEAGDVVCLEGAIASHLFLIVCGNIRVSHTTAAGREQPIAFWGPGDCLGEMALLDRGPRSATAVATCHAELMQVG